MTNKPSPEELARQLERVKAICEGFRKHQEQKNNPDVPPPSPTSSS